MIQAIFEISTTNYLEDKRLINNALSGIAGKCGLQNEFEFSEPTSKFGWTFFKLWIKPSLHQQIEQRLADMIKKSKGSKADEKFTNFLSDLFQASGCSKIKVKLIEV
ncbi:MAG: hypothetical protein QXE84_07195 [Candidatus Nitrosotenuis sp.]|uniref:Uncharacterized protein n=1 Tax=Candidatus Nitrosotenuis uzonensis TaxID=1407055 RepID=A0A812F1I5_9ARCH|nr:hypothetical protein [Candidatus Nitrosotenuis uzonensis]CAE6495204.1 conserved hypothetical protein [Candidatus Nitrosotenuis uzonensis]